MVSREGRGKVQNSRAEEALQSVLSSRTLAQLGSPFPKFQCVHDVYNTQPNGSTRHTSSCLLLRKCPK